MKNGRFNKYTARDGLFDDFTYQILEHNEDLWFSSGRGIYRVSKRELGDFADGKVGSVNSIPYGVKNGMSTNTCSVGFQPSGWKTKDGKLWFATVKGVVMTDPDDFKTNTEIPPVHIEEVLVNKKIIEVDQRIELPPNSSEVEIHYTGLSFIAPEKVKFKHRLEGFDKDWVDAGSRRIAYYANLAPGNYHFRVLASNNDNLWNESGAGFTFRLKPHFYQTYWFYAFCVLALVVAVGLVYRLRLRQVEAQFEAVLSERKRMATEIHDTLIQGIVGISTLLEGVSAMISDSPDRAGKYLERTLVVVRDTLDEARRSVWDMRSKALERGNLISGLTDIAKELIGENPIQIQIQINGTARRLPEVIENNLLRIGQEAIINAVKHARPSNLLVEINFDNKYVKLRVKDDGIGFDPSTRLPANVGHFGLLGMRERTERLGGVLTVRSAVGEGTEVLVEVLVDQHRL